MKLRTLSVAGVLLAAPIAVLADVKVNDNLTISGYIAGAYTSYSPSPGTSFDSVFDASKAPPGAGDANAIDLTFTGNFKPVTVVVSVFDFPNTSVGTTILDAYATYDAGGGLSITGGKFLSYLGYESFYPTLMSQISYANGDFLGAIPAYHTGLRADYTSGNVTFGGAVLDSVYSPYGYDRGDGELKHNAGFEGYVTDKIGDLTLWAGFAYDSKGFFEPHSVLTLDFWGQYQITKDIAAAAEYQHKDGGDGAKGYNWLTFLNANSGKWTTTLRISGEKMDDDPISLGKGFTKYTVCPGYNFTDHLLVRAEISYYDYSNYSANSATFWGIQAIVKF
ncbi:MAG TPA: outer membrane beta-barrel protein [Candidatus Didemnitutus sp.]|jgi:hypothetical protein